MRTVWWVYGTGPVEIQFQHSGGIGAAATTAILQSTNQMPIVPAPSDANYFPLKKGAVLKYRWTNSKWLKTPEVQQFTLDAVVNNSARFTVKDLSGPVKVAGTYGFACRNDGVTNLWGVVQAATKLKFPKLGPKSVADDKRRHFFTPFDLMTYGPAGTFQALVVRSTLAQQGFRYGSGTRTLWFAPGKGLVKLLFVHADHSVSTVELLK